jgi:hypothetical protein
MTFLFTDHVFQIASIQEPWMGLAEVLDTCNILALDVLREKSRVPLAYHLHTSLFIKRC